MLASFEMHVSFPLGRECGILFHCMFPDTLPERKGKKRTEKEKRRGKGNSNKRKVKKKSEKVKKNVLRCNCDFSLQ